jgi:hypothetical protein
MRKLLLLLPLLFVLPCEAINQPPTITAWSCAGATVTTCTATIPATVSPNTISLVTFATSTASIKITNVTGGTVFSFNKAGGWYHPGGGGLVATAQCAANVLTSGSIDCAFLYVTNPGTTSIVLTFGSCSNPSGYVMNIPYTNGPIQVETALSSADTSLHGQALTFNAPNQNEFIVQFINPTGTITGINGGYIRVGNIAYLPNTSCTGTCTAPTWTQTGGSSGNNGVLAIAFRENEVTASQGFNVTNWVAINRSAFTAGSTQCFNSGNLSITPNGQLQMLTQLITQTCSDIDQAPTSYSYTSASLALRTLNFQYANIDVRAKVCTNMGTTGCGYGVFMFDSGTQLSYPTGTDNNGTLQEIDIYETATPSTKTTGDGALHVPSIPYNFVCSVAPSDITVNYHDYQVIWQSGSVQWLLDGTPYGGCASGTTTTNVPATPMYLIMVMNAGGGWGTVTNGTLPWQSVIDYVRITCVSGSLVNGVACPAGTVIFDDEFNTPVGATN